MNKILFVTVGGSPKPIITAISSLNPDRVIFVCSSGSKGSQTQILGDGKPCEIRQGTDIIEKLPNIPTHLNLGSKFIADRDLVLIDNPDDLSESYQRIFEKIRTLQQENPTAQMMADYTGGTKTMSVALAMAALDYRLTVYLTTHNTRENLIKIERGERVRRATVASVKVNRTIEQILPTLLKQYNYPAALADLESLLQEMELSNEDSQRVQKLIDCCTGFDLWDRFNHLEAWGYLKPLLNDSQLRPVILFLKRVMGSRQAIAPAVNDNFQTSESLKGHGYEIVEDLIFNAQRRAEMARYDDAVARLYRALELLAQVRLWLGYEIKTGDLDLNKLPEKLRSKYDKNMPSENGKIQLALRDAYRLLSELDGDPLGELYSKRESAIFDKLQVRNYSILAHGLNTITKAKYQDNFASVILPFLEDGLSSIISSKSKLESVQFPTTF